MILNIFINFAIHIKTKTILFPQLQSCERYLLASCLYRNASVTNLLNISKMEKYIYIFVASKKEPQVGKIKVRMCLCVDNATITTNTIWKEAMLSKT